MFNKLLQRQLQKYGGEGIPEKYEALFQIISDSYDHYEKDRKMLERSIELSSEEMIALNEQLRKDIAIKRETEEALRRSQQRYQTFITQSSEGIWRFESEQPVDTNLPVDEQVELLYEHGYLAECNDVMAQMYGFSRAEELTGVRLRSILPRSGKNQEYLRAFIRQGYRGNEQESQELHRDGSERYFLNSLHGIIENGCLVRAWGIQRDITERKRAEEKIRMSEAHLSNSQRIAQIGSWELPLENRENSNTLHWSDEAYRIFGYEPGEVEITNELFFRHVHPDDRAMVQEAVRTALETKTVYTVEHRILRRDGFERVVHERGDLILDRSGKALKMIGTVQDITARKQAELALGRTQAKLRAILENTDTAYVLLDPQLNILSFNRLASELSKSQSDRAIEEGMNYLDLVPVERRAEVKLQLQRVLGEKQPVSYEANYEHTGTWLHIRIHPIPGDEKELLGLSIAATNITEQKLIALERDKMTHELLQRNKDLEQFAYIISHNLRAPVANILGLSNIIHTPDLPESDREKCLSGLAVSVKKLDEIILDLNYILQVRREINEKKEPVKFSGLVSDIQMSINNLIQKENALIETDFSEADELFTLKSYLNSIFYNLILNGIKYRRPEEAPHLLIRSRREGQKLLIIFRDNGLGIDMNAHGNKIFGLYKKFHFHTEGKGMGLYMVKTQVEILGGKISVESELNVGTEFTIEFEV